MSVCLKAKIWRGWWKEGALLTPPPRKKQNSNLKNLQLILKNNLHLFSGFATIKFKRMCLQFTNMYILRI